MKNDVNLSFRFCTELHVCLLAMELLHMDAIDSWPRGSCGSDSTTEQRMAYLQKISREIVDRACGHIPQNDVYDATSSEPAYPSVVSHEQLQIPTAFETMARHLLGQCLHELGLVNLNVSKSCRHFTTNGERCSITCPRLNFFVDSASKRKECPRT